MAEFVEAMEAGRVPDGTGLSSPTEPASGLGPAGFDPSRGVVKMTRIIRPEITIERGEGVPDGRREIWARHEDCPHLDTLLVTVHYSYAYQDNSTIGGVAVRIARLLGARDSDRSGEAMETPKSGSTEGESAGPKDIAQPTATSEVI